MKAIYTFLAIFFFLGVEAQVTNSGSSFSTSGGGSAWSNPSNVSSDDGNNATVNLGFFGSSEYLNITGFGFSIPTDEEILGVIVTVNKSRSSFLSYVGDSDVRLIVGGSRTGSSRASGTNYPIFESAVSYGADADLWGTTLTPAQVNSSNFGVAIASNTLFGGTAQIDHVTITIVSSPDVLPVELSSFTAELNALNNVELNWTTSMELNNDYFEIQKSDDGVDFETIGKVNGVGNSIQMNDYSFEDNLQNTGQYFYRLKQVDFDGTTDYSSVERLYFETATATPELYPNPAVNSVRFYNISSETVLVQIIGLDGKIKINKQHPASQPLNISTLKSGYYVVVINDNGSLVRQRLMVQ